jgi:hypothetical protein
LTLQNLCNWRLIAAVSGKSAALETIVADADGLISAPGEQKI